MMNLYTDEEKLLVDFFNKNTKQFMNNLFKFMDDNKNIKNEIKPFEAVINQLSFLIMDNVIYIHKLFIYEGYSQPNIKTVMDDIFQEVKKIVYKNITINESIRIN